MPAANQVDIATAGTFYYPLHQRHPAPLLAIREEVVRVRKHGATHVAVLGFSAGGHAAGLAALVQGFVAEQRIDAAILAYPVVSMLLETHAGSRLELIGRDANEFVRRSTSLETLVTEKAPPFFVWHTAADEAVPVEHSYLLGEALAAHKVPHELHVFPEGQHGVGLGIGAGLAEAWTELCVRWFASMNWIPDTHASGAAKRWSEQKPLRKSAHH